MKTTKIIKTGKCSRYHFCVIKNMTVTEVIINTKELFDNSWNVFAYTTNKQLIPAGVMMDKSWLQHDLIVFNSTNRKLGDWFSNVFWDDIGARHYSFYPKQLPIDLKFNEEIYTKTLSLDQHIELMDFFLLSKEWKSIHELGADLSIIKQKDSILIAALDKTSLDQFKTLVKVFNSYIGHSF